MKREDFLAGFKDFTGASMGIAPQTPLADVPEWDSLTAMSIVTLLASKWGVNLTLSDVLSAKTVADIMDKAGVLSK